MTSQENNDEIIEFFEEHIYFDNIKVADQKEIVSGGNYEN